MAGRRLPRPPVRPGLDAVGGGGGGGVSPSGLKRGLHQLHAGEGRGADGGGESELRAQNIHWRFCPIFAPLALFPERVLLFHRAQKRVTFRLFAGWCDHLPGGPGGRARGQESARRHLHPQVQAWPGVAQGALCLKVVRAMRH